MERCFFKLSVLLVMVAVCFPCGGSNANEDKEERTNKNKETPEGMVFVEGGTFQMGSDAGEMDEKPVHTVSLGDFYISKYEVTQAEYQAVMDTNPSCFSGDSLPVEEVSWYDAIEYCNALSIDEGLTPYYTIDKINKDPNNKSIYDYVKWTVICDTSSNGYRLPTESEWEYAARGGKHSIGYAYSGSNNLDDVAWYLDNVDDGKTYKVGTKAANELGVYDMSGNVYEWCWDVYIGPYCVAKTSIYYLPSGGYRVIRGGSWDEDDYFCRSAHRRMTHAMNSNSLVGFRVARSL